METRLPNLQTLDRLVTGKSSMKKQKPPLCFSFFFADNGDEEWDETYEALLESENYERESSTLGAVLPSTRTRRSFPR